MSCIPPTTCYDNERDRANLSLFKRSLDRYSLGATLLAHKERCVQAGHSPTGSELRTRLEQYKQLTMAWGFFSLATPCPACSKARTANQLVSNRPDLRKPRTPVHATSQRDLLVGRRLSANAWCAVTYGQLSAIGHTSAVLPVSTSCGRVHESH